MGVRCSHLRPSSFETALMLHGRKILNALGIIRNERPGVVPQKWNLKNGLTFIKNRLLHSLDVRCNNFVHNL